MTKMSSHKLTNCWAAAFVPVLWPFEVPGRASDDVLPYFPREQPVGLFDGIWRPFSCS